ncbi:hypothetical protein C8Q74DRAFT_937733 [Fomes fomentarius]|nr:hypothetical protein C8Q74DRAFT_937733 [Fomes fomentarius]
MRAPGFRAWALFVFYCVTASSAASILQDMPVDGVGTQAPLKGGSESFHYHPTACRFPLLDGDYQCGLLEVPLDYHNHAAGKGRVYYARLPASSEVTRKGTIFINPGFQIASVPLLDGPTWLSKHGDVVRNRTNGEYDIVAWYPRGTGMSLNEGADSLTVPGPVNCFRHTDHIERYDFYARAAAELGFEPHWNSQLHYKELQSDQVILLWHAIQEKVVEYCLSKVDTSMLRYMGTAATTRDLVAMTDAFDGPGSPVNFLGIGHGNLIGSYLLKMFPDRAGRVILDSPGDPVSYTSQDPIETWRADIQSANHTMARFLQGCLDHAPNGCRVAYQQDPEDKVAPWINMAVAIARSFFTGWRNTAYLDSNLKEFLDLIRTVHLHTDPPSELPNVGLEDAAQMHDIHAAVDESYGLGLMPVACGDLVLEHDTEEMRRRASEIPAALISSKGDAPLIMPSIVPSLRYMCHLWPYRAVERYSDFSVTTDHRPAIPVLILGYDSDTIVPAQNYIHVLRQRGIPEGEDSSDGAGTIMERALTVPTIAHGRCMSRVITDYLTTGKISGVSGC